jgi:hypothetical protein
MANDTKTATPTSGSDETAEAQLRRLEQLLNEGLDDVDAGQTVSRDEVRREIEALLAARKKTGTR